MKWIQFYKDSFSGLSKDVWFVALIYLINRCGEMVMPFMSVYLTSQLGFSKTQSGLVLFCFGLGALTGSNIGGRLSDSLGNFKVMLMSLCGTALAFFCIPLFSSFGPLCLWMTLTGICTSSFSPAAFSAVSMWGDPKNQTRGFSLLRMAINLGIAIGPAIGGFLAYKVGYEWLFLADGLTCLVAAIALFAVLGHRNNRVTKNEENHAESSSPYRDKALVLFLFFNLINMMAFFQILYSVPVYFKEVIGLDELFIGAFFTVNGLLIFIFEMPLVYFIEQRKQFFKPMALGALLIAAGFLSLGLFENAILAIVLFNLLLAFGEIINFPLIPTLVMQKASPENQGKYMGMVSMTFAMAFLLAPVSGLPLIEKIGFTKFWFIAASASTISGLALWSLRAYFVKENQ